MKTEKIKLDLWVLVVLLLLIPESINTVSDHSGSFLMETGFFLMGLVIVCLVMWLFKRCGVLIKYRYISIKMNCTMASKRSKYISVCLVILMVPAYGYILWITPVWDLILQLGYILI